MTPLSSVGAGKIVTLEGLDAPEQPHPLQQAFIDEQAVQCGYCINGMIMQSAALLRQNPNPSVDDDIKTPWPTISVAAAPICGSSALSSGPHMRSIDATKPALDRRALLQGRGRSPSLSLSRAVEQRSGGLKVR